MTPTLSASSPAIGRPIRPGPTLPALATGVDQIAMRLIGTVVSPAAGGFRACRRGGTGLGEAELGGFLEPRFGLADGAHLAGQADFAEDDGSPATGCPVSDESKRRRDREIGRRLADAQAARDVQIDVVRAEAEARSAPRAPPAPWRAGRCPSRPPRAAACRAGVGATRA